MTVPAGELQPIGLLRRPAGHGSVKIYKTSVKVPSFPPYTLEKVMATGSARKSGKPSGWRFCEGAHAPRP